VSAEVRMFALRT